MFYLFIVNIFKYTFDDIRQNDIFFHIPDYDSQTKLDN